jgi:NosR/NirI family transcriptional regulator, nitrous oxide reductase regulator
MIRWLSIVLILFAAGLASAQARFPEPEFSSGYTFPEMHTPPPALAHPWVDTAALAGALAVGAWLVLKRRSRSGVLALTIASVLYFGFWRKGCVCPVGSLQNVTAALVNPEAGVPWLVLVYFFLPLLTALFFGRIFCSGVCPLGALQELVAVRPIQLPRPWEHALGLLAYLYLGSTVLAVSLDAGFLICQYDPFVGFFRQGASFNMLLAGGIFLAIGMFVGRPYCRFLCPYGVLLGWMSRFSKWHASIPETECIQCRLCEEGCPYGAIDTPIPEDRPVLRRTGIRRMGWMLALTPVVLAVGAGVGVVSHGALAKLHPTVRLAERVAAEESGEFKFMTLESEAFRGGAQSPDELYVEARALQARFKQGAAWLGVFMGLVLMGKLFALTTIRKRTDYETNRTHCLSCARCFNYCPVEEENGHSEER